MQKLIYILLLCLAVIFFHSCATEYGEANEEFLELDFAPLSIGKYLVYEVDSTIFDNQGNTVTETSSFVREEMVETFIDEVGDTVYRVERLWRQNDLEDWSLTNVWSVKMQNRSLVRSEDNLRFVKLVFPPDTGRKWDGNQFVDKDLVINVFGEPLDLFLYWDDNYEILSRTAESVNGMNFDDVLTIKQAEEETLVERRFSQEQYAKGVGLVSKQLEVLDIECSDCPSQTTPWENKATKGFIMNQTLIDHN